MTRVDAAICALMTTALVVGALYLAHGAHPYAAAFVGFIAGLFANTLFDGLSASGVATSGRMEEGQHGEK